MNIALMRRLAGLARVLPISAGLACTGCWAQAQDPIDFRDLGRTGPPVVKLYTVPGLAADGRGYLAKFDGVDTERIEARRALASAGGSGSGSGSPYTPGGYQVLKQWRGGVLGVLEQARVKCLSGRKRGEEFTAWLHESHYWSAVGYVGHYRTMEGVAEWVCK